MAVTIPLNAEPYQQVKVPLSGVTITLTIQERTNGLYMDVAQNGTAVRAGILCQDRTWLVRSLHLVLPGDLAFMSTHGTSDHTDDGLIIRTIISDIACKMSN